MKQFNLQEYLKNPDRHIVTRDGKDAKIICTNAKGNFPIIALVETYNGNETVLRLKENGRFYNDTENSSDLFFATEKKNGWVNIYKSGNNVIFGSNRPYNSEELAKDNIMCAFDYLTTIKIDWEE